jgi:hypothetical protein
VHGGDSSTDPADGAATVARVRRSLAGLLLVVAVVAAGCGVRNSNPFTAEASKGCFAKHGFTGVTTAPSQVGFIAGFAEHGGLRAASPSGNVVTVAFTADADATKSTEEAFRARAPKSLRPHISDIMRTERNAVLVWTTTPDPGEYDTARRCLRS